MTSLAVEFSYNNLTASKGRHKMTIKNSDNATINNNSNHNNNNINNNNHGSNINNNNSFNNKNNNATFNNSNNNNNFSNLTNNIAQFSNHLPNTNKMSSNIIFNMKNSEGISNINNNETNGSIQTSLGLINRIKTIESQRKRTHQSPGSSSLKNNNNINTNNNNNTNNTPASTAVSNNYRNTQRVSFSASNEQLDLMHYSPASPVSNYINQSSPGSDRKSAKFTPPQQQQQQQRNSLNKSQEDLFKMRLKSATNPNAYQDKITDQKFFNRNFKLKNDSPLTNNPLEYSVVHSRHLNESPVSDIMLQRGYYPDNKTQNLFAQTNLNLTTAQNQSNNNTTIQLNKLKLLKKRNALKKTLSNANNNNNSLSNMSATTTSNLLSSSKDLINSSSKEDLYKSQNSLNYLNSSTKSMSRHLSRQSLNNPDNLTNTSYLNIRNSCETIDDLLFNDLKLRDAGLFKTKPSLVKAKSENELNEDLNDANKPGKGENYEDGDLILHERKNNLNSASFINLEKPKKFSLESQESRINKAIMANTSYLNRIKSVNTYQNSYGENTSRQKSSNARLDANNGSKSGVFKRDKSNDSGDLLNKSNNEMRVAEFKIVYPGVGAEIVKPPPPPQQQQQNESALDVIDPNNIMSDPVISEQFRKLYEEDEYFQAVHRKCSEWLLRYVIPEMESLRATKS